MKKFAMGILVGIAISTTGSVFADDIVQSIIGKEIQGSFPIKVNGKQLPEAAAVVDGTSYLPVRAMGEALNMEVSFNSDLGIELKSKGGETVTTQPATPQTVAPTPIKPRMTSQEIQAKIDEEKETIKKYKGLLEINQKLANDPKFPVPSAKDSDAMYLKSIADAEARIAELEKQLTELSQ